MAKRDVLSRVDADLARGHTHVAMQRLVSLTRADPHDLEVRERRAALNRQIGNWPEAGRWSFLGEHVEPAELEAFVRAYACPFGRLRALRLRADITDSLGPLARRRFADLVEDARQQAGGGLAWTDDAATPQPEQKAGCYDKAGCLVLSSLALAVLGLAIFGLVTLLRLIS